MFKAIMRCTQYMLDTTSNNSLWMDAAGHGGLTGRFDEDSIEACMTAAMQDSESSSFDGRLWDRREGEFPLN